MRFEFEYYGSKGVRLVITYSGLSLKEIIKALSVPYNEELMDELVTNPRFYPLKNTKSYERKSFLAKRIFRGQMVLDGAYDIYLKHRDDFLNTNDQSNKESEVR